MTIFALDLVPFMRDPLGSSGKPETLGKCIGSHQAHSDRARRYLSSSQRSSPA